MITQKARYAFKALIVLAGESQDRLRTEAIAARGAIPRKFLERILLELKASGLIESRRGRAGGYALVKHPSEITLGAVLRVIDGPIAPLSCISRTAYRRCVDCSDEANCALRRLFSPAYEATLLAMDAITLADGLPDGLVETLEKARERPVSSPLGASAEEYSPQSPAKETGLR